MCVYVCVVCVPNPIIFYYNQQAFDEKKISGDKRIRIVNEFQHFLGAAISYFRDLLIKLNNIAKSANKAVDAESCHQIYVYLGDLARYMQLHNLEKKKDFADAKRFYESALRVLPR